MNIRYRVYVTFQEYNRISGMLERNIAIIYGKLDVELFQNSGLAWSPDGRWIAFSSGGEVWAASLEAFGVDQDHLVRIGPRQAPG